MAKRSDNFVTASALADHWGVTNQTVTKLKNSGIIKKSGRGYDCDDSTRRYCAHLRDLATGRGGEAGIISATAERARLLREQADQVAMKNAMQRGELLDATETERTWADGFRTVRSAMLAIPSRCAGRLPYLSRADVNEIDRLVREALQDAGEGNAHS
jgi:terminase small subunit / prophage DNA-packing protein